MTDAELLSHFESLGDNCEFGLAQRQAGIEPLGFFRFNWAGMADLLRALDSDFADIGAPEQVEIETSAGGEFLVHIRDAGFRYHTFKHVGEIEVEPLRAQQIKAIRFLVRKIRDDLGAADRIFVRKGNDSIRDDQIAPLWRHLRARGQASLLWVVLAGDERPAGGVEVLEPGLLKGYIDRFAPYDDAHDFSSVWLDVCRNAYKLWKDASPAGTLLASPPRPVGGNLILHSDSFRGAWWRADIAAARLSDSVPRLRESCVVTEHELLEATSVTTGAIHGHNSNDSVSGGSIYVVSIYVWLPADFSGSLVGAVFDAVPSIRIANADMKARETWQRVWVSARIPDHLSGAYPRLYVLGPAGTRVFSTCWKMELGAAPTNYETPWRRPARPAVAAPVLPDGNEAGSGGKWYFAANARALARCFDQMQGAVLSARRHTSLRPHLLFDARGDEADVAERLAWLRGEGVSIIEHRAALFDRFAASLGADGEMFSGHWLRCDIPLLETEDAFVLYTDIDILFREDVRPADFAPPFIACAPEHRRDDFSYFNSGVMVMNLPALRQTRGELIEVLDRHLHFPRPHDDQQVLNAAYRGRWARLPDRYNWKPYWGFAADAAIVHFHGPKPDMARRMLAETETRYGAELKEMFARSPEGYARYLAEFDEVLKLGEARAPASPTVAKSSRIYRVASLAQLARAGAAERMAYLPASTLEVPRLAFGAEFLDRPGIVDSQAQGAGRVLLSLPQVDAYVLRDAVIHGRHGVVTTGEFVVGDSTPHLPTHAIPGAEWIDETRLRLPDPPRAASLPAAYHLMTCNLDNYCHWMLEAVARFSAAELRGYGVLAGAPPDMILVTPPLDTAWKRESLALALPRDIRPTALAARSATPVARLLYIPQFADGGLSPHRALLPVFERMRAAAYTSLGAEPSAPWRKLFISRADSANRVLVNEAELATVAAKAGFERVVLAGVPLAEQIRLFTEATRIVGAHGAGLTNLLFCRPGAVVCELHMDCYVQWAFRRLAALRGLRYGCVVGAHIPPRHDWPHRNRFRVDPAEFAAALDC